ncbi:MAG: type III toxin-antitoxin system ToxN/AbiQ family toxin [Acutalibacteraceae bacterium]
MEQPRFSLYKIDMKYVRNLSKADDNVMSVSPQINKAQRPFVGILILLNKRSYCIPLSSPKPKFKNRKNSVDFVKITHPTEINENGAPKIIGGLNINNMIPVDISLLQKIDLHICKNDSVKEREYKELMKGQLSFCQANQQTILKRANSLYDLVTKYPDDNRKLTSRCCNFKKLEKVLDSYLEKHRD